MCPTGVELIWLNHEVHCDEKWFRIHLKIDLKAYEASATSQIMFYATFNASVVT